MEKITELYRSRGFSLVMTRLAAGSVGPSYDTGNKNRLAALEQLGLESERVRFVTQRHTRDVIPPEAWSACPQTEGDGLIAVEASDCIAVTAADCMPVFLHDEQRGIRALLHSGWKGTGIVLEALRMMEDRYGSRPSDVTAVIGPSIGSCCYNVDRGRAEQFSLEWGGAASVRRGEEYFLSLKDANMLALERAGVRRIVDAWQCTSCGGNFGSFRREGPCNFTLMFILSYLNE